MIPHDADWIVTGWRGTELLVQTWHRGVGSKDCEVAAWHERLKRGEASHVDVLDRKTGKVQTIFPTRD